MVVVEVQFVLHAVVVDLFADLAVEYPDARLAPAVRVAELGEEHPREDEPLGLEQQVVALGREVARDMLRMAVVVFEKMQEKIGVERLGGQKIEELVDLELQPVAHLEGPPGEIDVFGLRPVSGLAFVIRREGVLAHPVEVFGAPLRSVVFVAREAVGFAHRHPPFHAVQLPAQFVVLHGPVLPVDVVAVEIGGLVALVDEETVLHRLVGPALFSGGDRDAGGVRIGADDARAAAVVVQQGFGGGFVVARGVQFGDTFQPGAREVQQREDRGVGLHPHQRGQEGQQEGDKQFYRFHGTAKVRQSAVSFYQ